MTLRRALHLFALASLIAAPAVVPWVAHAQEAQEPPVQAQALARFVGTWDGQGTMRMGRDRARVTVHMECRATSGSWGVLCSTRLTGIPGMASYEETDLMGYDPNDGLVHWYSVTNAGETHDHRGGFHGDTLEVSHFGPQQGRLFTETVTIVFQGATMRVVGTTYTGSERTSVFEVQATRR